MSIADEVQPSVCLPEMPGQYCNLSMREPLLECHPKVVRIIPTVKLVARGFGYSRRVTLLGSDGLLRYYYSFTPSFNDWRNEVREL